MRDLRYLHRITASPHIIGVLAFSAFSALMVAVMAFANDTLTESINSLEWWKLAGPAVLGPVTWQLLGMLRDRQATDAAERKDRQAADIADHQRKHEQEMRKLDLDNGITTAASLGADCRAVPLSAVALAVNDARDRVEHKIDDRYDKMMAMIARQDETQRKTVEILHEMRGIAARQEQSQIESRKEQRDAHADVLGRVKAIEAAVARAMGAPRA